MSDEAKEIIKDVENGILPKLIPVDYHGDIFGLQPMIEDNKKLDATNWGK